MINDNFSGAEPTTTMSSTRVYYIDWLRVLAMLSIFLFHTARFFDAFSVRASYYLFPHMLTSVQ